MIMFIVRCSRYQAHKINVVSILKTHYDIAITSTKNSKIIRLHHQYYNITLYRNHFYKDNQIRKTSTFGNFCSVLFLFSCSIFFLHSTRYFSVTNGWISNVGKRFKNRNFIPKNKTAELKQNKKSKQPDQSDIVWKLDLTPKKNH